MLILIIASKIHMWSQSRRSDGGHYFIAHVLGLRYTHLSSCPRVYDLIYF